MRTRSTPLVSFFLLVIALSAPFFVSGAVVRWQLLPGLPVSALAALCPALAASILVYQRDGKSGVATHLRRSFDFQRITHPIWYIPILLLMPAVLALSYGVMVVLGWPLPVPEFDFVSLLPMLVAFFIAGLGEELGWSAYAFEPLQDRWGALRAALVLGVFWAAWHVIPLLQASRLVPWIAWWALATLALRVLHVWIFVNTGKSVFGQALFHAMSNVAWQMFPNRGSHYDPAITGPLLATLAALVIVVFGSRTLVRGPRDPLTPQSV